MSITAPGLRHDTGCRVEEHLALLTQLYRCSSSVLRAAFRSVIMTVARFHWRHVMPHWLKLIVDALIVLVPTAVLVLLATLGQ